MAIYYQTDPTMMEIQTNAVMLLAVSVLTTLAEMFGTMK